MSTGKMIVLTGVLIGGVGAGIKYGGKSFFHEMAGGDCGPLGCASTQKQRTIWSKSESTPEQQEWIRSANAPQPARASEPTDEDLGYGPARADAE